MPTFGRTGRRTWPARREWLKTKYKLGTNTAWWLAERADGQPTWDESPEAYLAVAPSYVDEMFAGPKAALRPLADALMRLARTSPTTSGSARARRSSRSTAST